MGCDDTLNRARVMILSTHRVCYNKPWGNESDYIVIFHEVAAGCDNTSNRSS